MQMYIHVRIYTTGMSFDMFMYVHVFASTLGFCLSGFDNFVILGYRGISGYWGISGYRGISGWLGYLSTQLYF